MIRAACLGVLVCIIAASAPAGAASQLQQLQQCNDVCNQKYPPREGAPQERTEAAYARANIFRRNCSDECTRRHPGARAEALKMMCGENPRYCNVR